MSQDSKTPRGVAVAGDVSTAEAAAAILRAGGNAADAAVAGVFASMVSEPCLTGAFGGGVAMVLEPGTSEPVGYDMFAAHPGAGAERKPAGQFEAVEIDFGPQKQRFHIGGGSVAASGFLAGLHALHSAHGRLPLARVVEPAQRYARDGVPIGANSAYVFKLLEPIVTFSAPMRALFAPGGELLGEGGLFRLRGFDQTLGILAEDGPQGLWAGATGRALVAFVAGHGGGLTLKDLTGFEARAPRPVRFSAMGRDLYFMGPPSLGGALIACALELWAETPEVLADAGAVARAEALAAAFEMAARLKARTFEGLPFYEAVFAPGAVERMFAGEPMRVLRAAYAEMLGGAGEPPARLPRMAGNTTHISVLDAEGGAAAITSSNGETAGYLLPDTGIILNNFLGEEDLNPAGFHRRAPGERLFTMMAPAMVLRQGKPEFVLGSGGSNRIRTAIPQVLVNLLWRGMELDAAVGAPRIHYENGLLSFEAVGEMAQARGALEARFGQVSCFPELNMFFGGVHAAARDPGGRIHGAGDPRRGGFAAYA